MSQDWKTAFWGVGIGSALTLAVLWPTLLSLTTIWNSSQAYQYAWLIMPMVVYLLGWHHRPSTLAARPQPDYTGVFVAIVAAVLWGAADLMNIDAGRQFALVLALQGIAMSALGWRSYWKLAPIFALMFLMVPCGDLLQPVLRYLTVKIIEWFAVVAHLPHSVDGFVVSIGANEYVVLNECAGLAYFMLATFLGYSFGLLLYRSIFKIAALTLFGAFIGVFSNGLRVSTIILIDWMNGSQMPLNAHANIQWFALIVALGLLLFVLLKLSSNEDESTPSLPLLAQKNSLRQFAPAIAGLSVLLIAGAVISLKSYSMPPTRTAHVDSVAPDIPGWERTSSATVWSVDQQRHIVSLALSYRRNGKNMGVLIVEPLADDAKLQDSDLAPGNVNVWHENNIKSQTSCASAPCLTLLHTTWENGKTEEIRQVYSTYSIGNFTTNSKLALRAAHGWGRLSGSQNNPRLVTFTLDAATPSIDEIALAFRLLQSALNAANK